MTKQRLYIRSLVAVRVRELGKFLEFIAEHDLWDEVEQHLKDRGCTRLLMSQEPLHAIAGVVEARSAALVGVGSCGAYGDVGESPAALKCASNGTNKPPPKTPK